MAPEIAQVKFLAGKVDTDLEGRALVSGLAPGDYWISSLNLDADSEICACAGMSRSELSAGKPSSHLSNLNSIDVRSSAPSAFERLHGTPLNWIAFNCSSS